MAADVAIVPATASHVELILPRVRRADHEEFWASSMSTPAQVIEGALRLSDAAWTGLVDGDPVTIFGVCPGSVVTAAGIPWLVSTDLVEQHARVFIRHSRPVLQQMREQYTDLWNYVDSRNAAAIRWLRWLGFTIGPARPRGPFGVPFHRFEMRCSHV